MNVRRPWQLARLALIVPGSLFVFITVRAIWTDLLGSDDDLRFYMHAGRYVETGLYLVGQAVFGILGYLMIRWAIRERG